MRGLLNRSAIKLLTAAVLLAVSLLTWRRGQEIEVRTAVGPGIPGKYKHAPSACELTSGEILLVYYSGSGEYGRDTAIFASDFNRTTEKWSRPRIIADAPDMAEGNPALWRAPNGRIFLFYPVRHGETWATAHLAVKVSADEGASWAEAAPPSDQPGFMTRARPLTLEGGACLLPSDFNPSTDTEFVSAESGSLFFRSDPELESWSATDIIHSRLGNHQPAVAAVDGSRLVAYCRRGGDYAGRADGRLVRSESRDGGVTWSPGVETELPNPNAPVDFVRLQSGNLLLAFNDSAFERNPLSVAISADGGRTFPARREIIRGTLSYSYPCALQVSDGTIYLFFTAGARSHIKCAKFREQDIIGDEPG